MNIMGSQQVHPAVLPCIYYLSYFVFFQIFLAHLLIAAFVNILDYMHLFVGCHGVHGSLDDIGCNIAAMVGNALKIG